MKTKLEPMNTVRVTLENGDWFVTSIRLGAHAARDYYLGRLTEVDETKPLVRFVKLEWWQGDADYVCDNPPAYVASYIPPVSA